MTHVIGPFIPLAILALTISLSYADLLDTEAQLERRYGAVTKVDGRKREYVSGPYIIEVELASETYLRGLFEGQVIHQSFRRSDDKPMWRDEVLRCLPTKEYGGVWHYDRDEHWRRQSPHGTAYLTRSGRELRLTLGKL